MSTSRRKKARRARARARIIGVRVDPLPHAREAGTGERVVKRERVAVDWWIIKGGRRVGVLGGGGGGRNFMLDVLYEQRIVPVDMENLY